MGRTILNVIVANLPCKQTKLPPNHPPTHNTTRGAVQDNKKGRSSREYFYLLYFYFAYLFIYLFLLSNSYTKCEGCSEIPERRLFRPVACTISRKSTILGSKNTQSDVSWNHNLDRPGIFQTPSSRAETLFILFPFKIIFNVLHYYVDTRGYWNGKIMDCFIILSVSFTLWLSKKMCANFFFFFGVNIGGLLADTHLTHSRA